MSPNALSNNFLEHNNADVQVNAAVDGVAELQRLVSGLQISDEEKRNVLDAITARQDIDYEGILELPWNVRCQENEDIEKAKQIMDQRMSAMEVVKERVVEFMTARSKDSSVKPPLLFLNGPEGVGKSTAAEMVAEALGRPFQWISVDTLLDGNEVTGSQNTIGFVMRAIRSAKCCNPVVLLDDVDEEKEEEAILEGLRKVLDPKQNSAFVDASIGIPFDLSEVFFIVTTNESSTKTKKRIADEIPVEKIDLYLDGYSNFDKIVILKNQLLAQEVKRYALSEIRFEIEDDVAEDIIDDNTNEAGVRRLGTTVGHLCRALAIKYLNEKKPETFAITKSFVLETLGEKAQPTYPIKQWKTDPEYGISFLAIADGFTRLIGAIETCKNFRNSTTLVTGSAKEDTKSAVKECHLLLKQNLDKYGIVNKEMMKGGIHVHFPNYHISMLGADVGAATILALVSQVDKRRIRVDSVADGVVNREGAMKKAKKIALKVHAAYREGFKRFVLPKENEKDVEALHETLKSRIQIVFVETVQELLDDMLEKKEN
ncbi:hypothetical protein QR680_018720 [Steinernema hermaphroditum]|uniref:AAA+ ATPase domain-containing protein n=1 Tax=Steinernema hermaphroditum TaxID=289476 RepID=A0AA39LQS4_9BILA|nr:hypothetical protein QR680_018720 [Steinernema hermaphroditum]